MGAAFSRDTVSVAAARVGFCNHIEAFAGAPPPAPPCKEKYLLPILSCGCPVLFSQLRGQSGPHSNSPGAFYRLIIEMNWLRAVLCFPPDCLPG